MGVYAFEPAVAGYIEAEAKLDFPELIERLLDHDELVASYEHQGYWADVGQLHDLETAVEEFERDAERFVRGGSTGLTQPKSAQAKGFPAPLDEAIVDEF